MNFKEVYQTVLKDYPEIMSVEETSAALGVSTKTVYKMLKNGVPMKQIQEWLGHSDFSTTANIYAHLDYNSKLNSAEAMVTGMRAALTTVS